MQWKLLTEEISADLNREIHWVPRLEDTALRCQFSQKRSVDLMKAQLKSQQDFFVIINKLIIKFVWKVEGLGKKTQNNFESEKKLEDSYFLMLRLTINLQ